MHGWEGTLLRSASVTLLGAEVYAGPDSSHKSGCLKEVLLLEEGKHTLRFVVNRRQP